MKVSVVIPTYNRAHLLSLAIDSVFEQTFSDFEIIVIDDGSTDNTAELLHSRYADKIRYFHQENQGTAVARNSGVDKATGKYIAFLDNDDLWTRDKLKLQVAIMEDYPELAFLFTEFSIMEETGKLTHWGLETWFNEPVRWQDIFDQKIAYSQEFYTTECPEYDHNLFIGNLYYSLLSNPYILPSTSIIRKDAISLEVEHTVGDPFLHDWNFFALLSKYNKRAGFLRIETTINRSHNDKVRITRTVKELEKLQYRLSAVKQIWKADMSFMSSYAKDVNLEESRILLQLAKQLYWEHRNQESLECLEKLKEKRVLEGKKMAILLGLLIKLPGSRKLLSFLR